MQWKPPEVWERLKNGIGCPMCEDIHLYENRFNYMVAELQQSYVRLPKNQYMHGWTIVALKRHANELFELSSQELAEFWQDVAIVARALNILYQPTKINYCIFGHHCPHLHCHLLVHSYADDPSKPVDMNEQELFLSSAEYNDMITCLRQALETATSAR